MKQGDKVIFYTESVVKGKTYTRQYSGVLIRFDNLICEVVPDGKTKTIVLPRTQVREA